MVGVNYHTAYLECDASISPGNTQDGIEIVNAIIPYAKIIIFLRLRIQYLSKIRYQLLKFTAYLVND